MLVQAAIQIVGDSRIKRTVGAFQDVDEPGLDRRIRGFGFAFQSSILRSQLHLCHCFLLVELLVRWTATLFVFLALACPLHAEEMRGKVVHIADGDTITVLEPRIIVDSLHGHWSAWFEGQPESAFGGDSP